MACISTRSAAAISAVASTLVFGGASSIARAADIFMAFPGVVGDSTERNHPREVVLQGFSAMDTLNLATAAAGGGGGAGRSRPVCGQVTVTKNVDRASPKLLALMFTGVTTTGPVKISFANTGDGGGQDFYQVEIFNAIVDSVAQTDSNASIITESVQIHGDRFRWTFNAQGGDGGVTPFSFGWDCRANRAF
jgi:type VI secretion system secreted protein Hcp